MHFQQLASACLLAVSSLAVNGEIIKRASTTKSAASTTQSLVADAQCTHDATHRACWSGGYSIATDFDKKHPTTGKTVSYSLDITNSTCNVDGHGKQECYLINGQYPGPTIHASWGDMISVTVKNSLKNNGTGIHWHGIRQLNSNGADGVGGITECPLAPGDSTTYTFQATQFGSSWYHSHHSSQYGLGVIGGIVIDGPSTSNYDVDLGTFMVNDWYYQGAWEANAQTLTNLQAQGQPPTGDALLVNGTSKSTSGGKYQSVTIQPGKKHRLRLVNPSVDNFIRVKLDSHAFTIISADFIPVTPIPNQDWILLGIGQRYDVIFNANATAGTYWFRAEVAGDCLSANNGKGRALFTYKGASATPPTDANTAGVTNGCAEIVTVPYWKQSVDQSTFAAQVQQLTTDLTMEQVTTNGANLVLWALNRTAMNIDWAKPTLEYIMTNNGSYPAEYDVIEIPNENTWTYWIVQTLQTTEGPTAIAAPPPPHPIHLHGHDFFVLGSGAGQFSGSASGLNFANPPRRDTATLPSDGWLAIAFNSNNPGSWLMHCHIAWHISEGLGVQFVESKSQIVLPDATAFNKQCANWKAFQAKMPYPKYDSGL